MKFCEDILPREPVNTFERRNWLKKYGKQREEGARGLAITQQTVPCKSPQPELNKQINKTERKQTNFDHSLNKKYIRQNRGEIKAKHG